jgi:hypothetical protein
MIDVQSFNLASRPLGKDQSGCWTLDSGVGPTATPLSRTDVERSTAVDSMIILRIDV